MGLGSWSAGCPGGDGLREQAARSNSNTHWIVRNAIGPLDPAEQAEIVRLLRS